MKKTILITSLMALMCGAVFAQPAGDQASASPETAATSSSGTGRLSRIGKMAEATDDINTSATNFLRSNNLGRGENENGLYIEVGTATIKAKPTDDNFEDARAMAYLEALGEVKTKIANTISQKIEAKLTKSFDNSFPIKMEATSGDGIDSGLLGKITTLANAKIDKELKKEGVSSDSDKGKEIMTKYSKSLTSFIGRSAASQVGGFVVLKIFEQDGKIAVIAYKSPATLKLAGALNGKGKAPKVGKREGKPINQMILDYTKLDLYLSQGVELTADKEGNAVLLAYGASVVPVNADSILLENAKKTAEANAATNIRRFAGEYVKSTENYNDLMKSSATVLDEPSQSMTEIVKTMNYNIELYAKSLKIPGIVVIREESFKDPDTNNLIIINVSMWSAKSADNAIDAKEEYDKNTTPGTGYKRSATSNINNNKKDVIDSKSGSTKYKGEGKTNAIFINNSNE